MAHKYLDDILPKGKTPYDFECDDEIRNQKWKKEAEEYGFDERETQNLDFTFFCWLYERLRKYKEVSPVDLNCKIVKVNDEEKNLGEWIDIMINNAEALILLDMYSEENIKLAEFTIEIFKQTIFYLWW